MNFMVYLLAIFTAHCPPMTYRFINYLTVVFTSSLSRRSTAVTPPHLMEPFLDPHLKVVQDTVCLSVPCEFMQWSRQSEENWILQVRLAQAQSCSYAGSKPSVTFNICNQDDLHEIDQIMLWESVGACGDPKAVGVIIKLKQCRFNPHAMLKLALRISSHNQTSYFLLMNNVVTWFHSPLTWSQDTVVVICLWNCLLMELHVSTRWLSCSSVKALIYVFLVFCVFPRGRINLLWCIYEQKPPLL